MSELMARVEMVSQYVELYEDEVRVQMPLALPHDIKIKDISGIEFKKANFFVAGKLAIQHKEQGVSQKVSYPFNFMFNDEMQAFVSMLSERRAAMEKEAPPEVAVPEVVVREVIKVRCQYCEGLMDENAETCPVCGRHR
jgi:aspartate carbamoyltransferase regulatory subunit